MKITTLTLTLACAGLAAADGCAEDIGVHCYRYNSDGTKESFWRGKTDIAGYFKDATSSAQSCSAPSGSGWKGASATWDTTTYNGWANQDGPHILLCSFSDTAFTCECWT